MLSQLPKYHCFRKRLIHFSLIAKYFDVIDPVYPMIHRESFLRDYDFFWSLSPTERPSVDGSLVALIFVILAMGTQFVALPSSDDKEQTAEFYGMSRWCTEYRI